MAPPPPSFFLRLRYILTIYAIKFATRLQKLLLNHGKQKPTYIKSYSCLPGIENNVFLPPTWRKGDPPLPLLIDIHGGGFTIGAPAIDNPDNHLLASHGICVVSIGYRLAPGYKFPTAVYDVALLINAVLSDPDLPIDKTKVAVAGYSAGGNLALTAPQLNDLHTRIKGVVAYYPVTDMGRSMAKRAETAISPPGRQDVLLSMSPMFRWAYFSGKIDLRDPLLAPLYASRNRICEKVYIMGCEWDLLCTEAEEAAEVYAAVDGGERIPLPNGRIGWTQGNVTWEKLLALEHGYNQRIVTVRGERKKFWQKRMVEMHENVTAWLFKEVYE